LKVLTAISQFDTKRGLIVLMQIEVLEGQEEYGPEVAIMEPAEAILQECLRQIAEVSDENINVICIPSTFCPHFLMHLPTLSTRLKVRHRVLKVIYVQRDKTS
jgi:hypothetical protein